MRGRLGRILDGQDRDAVEGGLADVTLRRFWSSGPRADGDRSERTAGAAQVIDLAAYKARPDTR